MLRWRHGLAFPCNPAWTASRISCTPRSLRHYSERADDRPEHNIAILGGGITGLASAYFLTKELPRAKITIYEASDRLGGWVNSKRVPVKDGTVLFEAGPRTLRPSGNGVLAAMLTQELDLAKDAIFTGRSSPAAVSRYVYYPDHLVRMPHPAFGFAENLWSVLTEPVFKGAILAAAKELFVPPRDFTLQDESCGEFFSRRLSKDMVDRVLSAVLHGIYAGDVWQLSAKSLFPQQWRDEATEGGLFKGVLKRMADGVEVTSKEATYLKEMKAYNWDPLLKGTLKDTTVFTFKDGMGMLTDALARYLVENGNIAFRSSTPVAAISPASNQSAVEVQVKGSEKTELYTHAISALSPKQLNFIHGAWPGRNGSPPLLPAIPSVTVMTVTMYFRTPNLHPPGFGYLIPQAVPFEYNPERALGVVFDTAYSPSPDDLNVQNWHIDNIECLIQAREQGQLVNVNDFAWYNMPNKPNAQDDVSKRGTKLTVMLGGHWWDDWPAYPDEKEGLALARSVLERHLGIIEEPEAYQVNLQCDCIPQYTVGHERRLREGHNSVWRQYKGRLRVAGNWISGVGVNDCLRSAYDVAISMGNGRDGTGLEHIGTQEYVRLKSPTKP
ncbi:hypothetical protein M433DRAFT_154281 [Acidomyces richmondensis BFW]|nr:MAG: hypothetical protein FE78DRAFT_90317 [Acidomyces sp. 'richmondensis']KYG45650.1 hypothetical protein M433DRAFT_154281 [Acidomyces richmondensis BFW]